RLPDRDATSVSAESSDIVIVGAGLAGFHLAGTLVAQGYAGKVALVGEEPWPPYDRPPLSKQYQRDGAEAALWLAPDLSPDVRQLRGRKAVAIDTAAGCVKLDDDSSLFWGQLVIATGARPRMLPHLQGSPRVHTLRTLADARAIRAALEA